MREMRARFYGSADFGRRVLGFASTATSRDATSITDPIEFGGSNVGEFQFDAGWIRLQHLTDANGRVKRAGALTDDALAHADETDWLAPFTGLAYEYTWAGIHPDEFDQCIVDGLRHVYVQNNLPATLWEDGNFEAADQDSWAGTNADLDKLGDQVYGNVGSLSLVVSNTAANGYASHTTGIKVQPGQRLQLNALALCVQGGPIRWRLYDFTGGIWGDEIETAAVGYGYTAQHFRRTITVPADCYLINCRMQNDAVNGITAWDALPSRNLNARRFALDSYVRAGFNITALLQACYGETLQSGTNAEDAASLHFEAFKRGSSGYDTEHNAGNSSPNAIRLNLEPSRIGDVEFWFGSQRSWYDYQPIAELTPSDCPEELAFAGAAVNLCDLMNKDGSDPYFGGVRAKYKARLDAQAMSYIPSTPPPRRQHIGGRIGPR